MKVAYLGPFSNKILQPFINSLTDEDCIKSPGMQGIALDNIVIPRIEKKKPTTVITLDWNLINETIIRKSRYVSLYSLPRRKRHLLVDLYKKEKKYILSAIEDSKPDILHVHWTYEYALATAKIKNIPKLLTVHDHMYDVLRYGSIRYLPNYLLSLYAVNKFNNITTVSEYVFNLINKIKLTKGNIYIVSNVLPNMNNKYYSSSKNNDQIIITSSSGWNKLKNPINALKAFSIFNNRHPGSILNLAGPGLGLNEEGFIWAKKNNLTKNVNFLGYIKHDDFIKILSNSTIYLHTSRTEALSVAIYEAMILGVPVIGGKYSGGVPYQLGFGKYGLLVDIVKPEDIADALEILIINEELYSKLKKQCQVMAKEKTNPEIVLRQYEDIYEKVINDSH